MNAGWNFPDGVHPFDVPHNGAASELQAREWEANRREVEAQARCELVLLCAMPGSVRNEYLEYGADHGPMFIPQYVSMLERIGAARWTRTVDLIWQQQFAWSEL